MYGNKRRFPIAVTINEGTQTDIYTIVNAGTEIPIVKLDIGAGSAISDFGGTILTVNNLTNGTVRVSVGTITTGTIQNVVSGTITALASGTITGGTLQAGTVTVGAALPAGLNNIGDMDIATGTVTRVSNIGTLENGTVLTLGIRHPDEFATVVTSGTSTLGTIRAASVGSAIYVTGIVISVQAASNVVVASGGTSTPILGTLFFAGSGGVAAMPFDPPIRTASGSALVYQQSANTGMSITCTGYVD